MSTPIEARLREAASRLSDASHRYAAARVEPSGNPHRRYLAPIAAAFLTVTAIVVTAVVITHRHDQQQPALTPPSTSPAAATSFPAEQLAATTTASSTTTDPPTTTSTAQPARPPGSSDPTHEPVSDSNGVLVGWVDQTNRADMIVIPLPASYTAANPLNPSAIGVQIVRDSAGAPVGLLTGLGFIRGGLIDATHIDPALEQQLIDNAINTISVSTVATPTG